jgi:hypothetical protein
LVPVVGLGLKTPQSRDKFTQFQALLKRNRLVLTYHSPLLFDARFGARVKASLQRSEWPGSREALGLIAQEPLVWNIGVITRTCGGRFDMKLLFGSDEFFDHTGMKSPCGFTSRNKKRKINDSISWDCSEAKAVLSG